VEDLTENARDDFLEIMRFVDTIDIPLYVADS
jgi:hypothetical protein